MQLIFVSLLFDWFLCTISVRAY